MKKKFLNLIMLVVFFLGNIVVSFAQGLPNAPEGGDDDPMAPANIDNAIVYLAIAATLLAFFAVKRNLKAVKN